MIYFYLFWVFFQIGFFTFGGGYAALPLIEHYVIEQESWLTMAEFADLLAISQITPGPIALNAATFIGTRVGGILGAVTATFGNIAPACVIVLILAYFYQKYRTLEVVKGVLDGLRPAVVALIGSAGVSVIVLALWGDEPTFRPGDISVVAACLFAAGLFALRKWKVKPVWLMLGTGLAAMCLSFFVPVT